jgi:hypothetical protein
MERFRFDHSDGTRTRDLLRDRRPEPDFSASIRPMRFKFSAFFFAGRRNVANVLAISLAVFRRFDHLPFAKRNLPSSPFGHSESLAKKKGQF